jgi:hypothetical protein
LSDENRKSDIGIRNDQIRREGLFGPGESSVMMVTPGVMDLGEDVVAKLVIDFMRYDAFEPGDDSFGDRDFGTLDAWGTRVWFKIDPKNDEPENRVITFLLPEEN